MTEGVQLDIGTEVIKPAEVFHLAVASNLPLSAHQRWARTAVSTGARISCAAHALMWEDGVRRGAHRRSHACLHHSSGYVKRLWSITTVGGKTCDGGGMREPEAFPSSQLAPLTKLARAVHLALKLKKRRRENKSVCSFGQYNVWWRGMTFCTIARRMHLCIYIKSPGKTTIGLKGHWRFEVVTVLKNN